MKHCIACNRQFTPRQPHHRYCDHYWAKKQGWQRAQRPPSTPWHPSFDWLLGHRLIWWFLLIVLPALIIYAIGRLLGWW